MSRYRKYSERGTERSIVVERQREVQIDPGAVFMPMDMSMAMPSSSWMGPAKPKASLLAHRSGREIGQLNDRHGAKANDRSRSGARQAH